MKLLSTAAILFKIPVKRLVKQVVTSLIGNDWFLKLRSLTSPNRDGGDTLKDCNTGASHMTTEYLWLWTI